MKNTHFFWDVIISRLETMEEEDEDDVQSNLSTSQPFLSGVFKDVSSGL